MWDNSAGNHIPHTGNTKRKTISTTLITIALVLLFCVACACTDLHERERNTHGTADSQKPTEATPSLPRIVLLPRPTLLSDAEVDTNQGDMISVPGERSGRITRGRREPSLAIVKTMWPSVAWPSQVTTTPTSVGKHTLSGKREELMDGLLP